MQNLPLYQYSMDLLINEEMALGGQPRWYKGASDGKTWIFQVANLLAATYYRE